jgi:hypothetical protein
MVELKENELAFARERYAEAYEPVREERTLEALDRQHWLLGAADALEKRARAIHAWPVAEGTWGLGHRNRDQCRRGGVRSIDPAGVGLLIRNPGCAGPPRRPPTVRRHAIQAGFPLKILNRRDVPQRWPRRRSTSSDATWLRPLAP